MVASRYAAPNAASAQEIPTELTSSPAHRPPSGISAKQTAVDSELTRPTSPSGIRS